MKYPFPIIFMVWLPSACVESKQHFGAWHGTREWNGLFVLAKLFRELTHRTLFPNSINAVLQVICGGSLAWLSIQFFSVSANNGKGWRVQSQQILRIGWHTCSLHTQRVQFQRDTNSERSLLPERECIFCTGSRSTWQWLRSEKWCVDCGTMRPRCFSFCMLSILASRIQN